MVTFLWIVFDVAISVRMMTSGYPLWEVGIWFGVGSALAVTAWIHEYREEKETDKRMEKLQETVGDLRQELSEARGYQAGKIDLVALLGGAVFNQLQDITHTSGEPVVTTIEMAAGQIRALETEVKDLTSMFWRRLTDDEKAQLKQKFSVIGQYSFRIVSAHPADCHELAGELARVLESAGWRRAEPPAYIEEHDLDDWDLAHTSGIRILGKYPADNEPGAKLHDALAPLIKGGTMFGASLRSNDVADVVLFIGPKGARTVQP